MGGWGGGEDWGDDTDGSSGNVSSASGTSVTRDEDSFMGGANGTTGAAEDGGEWQQVTRCRRKCGGWKARARRRWRRSQRAGDRDGAAAVTKTTQGEGDSANKA